jgi:outer membrane protein
MRQKISRKKEVEMIFSKKQAGAVFLSMAAVYRKITPACFLTILAMLMLSGCRNVNAPAIPYAQWAPPAGYSSLSSDDKVWTNIRSRAPVGGEPLTLAQLLDIAFENSPVTSRAWHEVRAKKASLGREKSDLFPQITIGADGRREKAVSNIGEAGNHNHLRYGPTGRAELLLFDFGGRDAGIEAAYQDLLSSGFAFNQALQDMMLDVKKNYYGLFSANSNLEAAEANVIDAKEAFDAAEIKFHVGIVSKLDKLQAESSYNNALYDLEDAKGALKTAQADLAVTVGFSADTAFEIEKPPKELTFNIEESDISAMIDQALSDRPDIAAARSSLMQKQAQAKEAASSLWPKVNLGGTYEHDWYKYYNTRQSRDDGYDYAGYLSLSWDIFDGFYNINKKLQAEAELQAELEGLKEIQLLASADVWRKYYNYNTAVKKLEFSRAYLESSMASHELALEGYSQGARSMLDLLQAQSALSNARARIVDSERGLYIALAELAHATGSLSAE